MRTSRAQRNVTTPVGRWSVEAQADVFDTHSRETCAAYPAIFDEPLFNQCVPEASASPPVLAQGFIYQHVRSLQGVKSSHRYPLADSTQTPSCGPAVDALLQGFGYEVNSKLIIAQALNKATSMGEFVARMTEEGLAALEAKYMWDLYCRDPPTSASQWSMTHFQ